MVFISPDHRGPRLFWGGGERGRLTGAIKPQVSGVHWIQGMFFFYNSEKTPGEKKSNCRLLPSDLFLGFK